MISWHDFYTILATMIPLYFAIILAYGSVRWWKIFTADQCSGINRFLATFAYPFLIFHSISTTNPYAMNLQFIAADSLQKIVILIVLGLWTKLTKTGSLDWMITLFSISTIPNTLILGVPFLASMYGEVSGSLMIQVFVLQCIVWFNVLLFLFEFRAAQMLVKEKFSDTAASIVSFKVDSDVASLDDHDFLETATEIGDDGMLHVTIRKSNTSRPALGLRSLTAPRRKSNSVRLELGVRSLSAPHGGVTPTVSDNKEQSGRFDQGANEIRILVADDPSNGENKEENFGGKNISFGDGGANGGDEKGNEKIEKDGLPCSFRLGSNSIAELNFEAAKSFYDVASQQMPPTNVLIRLILTMVWRRVIRNPNIHSSVIGLVWSLVAFRWHVVMPKIIENSVSIISNTGLGVAMFSLGLFMALQPKIISCGNKVVAFSMVLRFLIGPAVMAVCSMVIGIRGNLLHIAIVQAALPQGIVPFIYAKEYNLHAAILNNLVIFGTFIGLPIALLYYIVLGL